MEHSNTHKQMGRKGQSLWIAGGVVLAALAIAIVAGIFVHDRFWGTPSQPQQLTIVGNGGGAQELQSTGNNCGTSRTSTITFTQQNGLNTTGNEGFDSTCYVYKYNNLTGVETYVATQTDTTAGTLSADCNQQYRMYCVSTDSNGGDSGRILSVVCDGVKVISETDDKQRTVDGAGIEFLTNAPTYSVTWKGKQHATLQLKAYDMMSGGQNMYNDADSSQYDYETDGVNFTSISANTTATTVGSGGTLDVKEELQATDVDTDFSDFGFYVGVQAATTVWDGTSVNAKFTSPSGSTSTLSNLKGNLDTDENLLFENVYQYVYFVPDSIRQDSAFFELKIKALSGINPDTSDDVGIDYISKGAVLRTAGESAGVKYRASNDASSKSAIFTIIDTNIATV